MRVWILNALIAAAFVDVAGLAVAQQRQVDPAPPPDKAALCEALRNRYPGAQVLTNSIDIAASLEILACAPAPPVQVTCFEFSLHVTSPLTTDEIQSIRDGIEDAIPRIQEACALVMPK